MNHNYSIIDHVDGPTAYFYAGRVDAGNPGTGGFEFVWNWINVFGIIVIVLLLLPNIVYAIKHRDEKNLCENRLMNILEQVGRYGSMLFMVICLKNGGYGFSALATFLIYGVGNLLLIISYWIVWGVYFHETRPIVTGEADGSTSAFIVGKRKNRRTGTLKMALAVLPACLFLLDGITLGYIPLLISAILFAVGHIYITYQNVSVRSTEDLRENV